jgi:hypothetical protein
VRRATGCLPLVAAACPVQLLSPCLLPCLLLPASARAPPAAALACALHFLLLFSITTLKALKVEVTF